MLFSTFTSPAIPELRTEKLERSLFKDSELETSLIAQRSRKVSSGSQKLDRYNRLRSMTSALELTIKKSMWNLRSTFVKNKKNNYEQFISPRFSRPERQRSGIQSICRFLSSFR